MQKMEKDSWKEEFLKLNNDTLDEDDLIFLVKTNQELTAARKPIAIRDDRGIDYPQTVKLNRIIQMPFLIAISICSIDPKNSQIICTQRFQEHCLPTPTLRQASKYLEFSSVVFPEFAMDQRDSLLCIEIVQTTNKPDNAKPTASDNVGGRYQSIRPLGRLIFEGSISFENIMDMFKPLNFTKTFILHGPYNPQGKVTIWVAKRLSLFSSKEKSRLRIKISNIELDWNNLLI
jgi:uncharacterized protein YqfB (UPF0267 family)